MNILLFYSNCLIVYTIIVKTVFDDDPVVQEHLLEHGSDWKLVPSTTHCSHNTIDSDTICSVIQNFKGCEDSMSYHNTIVLLSVCRRECQDYYRNHSKNIPDLVDSFGGVEDVLPQPFGFSLPVCSAREGYFNKSVAYTQINFQKFIPEIIPFIPPFTRKGFMQSTIPTSLFDTILKFRSECLKSGKLQTESLDPGIINGHTVVENLKIQESKEIIINRTQMMNLDESTKEIIFKTLGPLAERWANLKLTPTSIYGIRRYRNMSTLLAHVDQTKSHVISAIMNIGQDVQEDWPLYIKDNDGNDQVVILKPGEMVWYESARLIHGRQKPLRGNFYDNVFIHYKPKGLWYQGHFEPNDPVMKISAEAVRWSQRKMIDTNWENSWTNFLRFEMDKNLRSFGFGDSLTSSDEYDEFLEEPQFSHINSIL